MAEFGDIVRELREDYPAVDVTTVVFSRDFAGVGCCVIPQDRVLAITEKVEALVKALHDVIATYEYCSEDPVDRGWVPVSDAIEDARRILAPVGGARQP